MQDENKLTGATATNVETNSTAGYNLTERLPDPQPLVRSPGQHVRAGFTKSKGRGQSKQRRLMARQSRRRNRR